MDDTEKHRIYQEFKKSVNMSASEIEHFLDTEDSKRVGQKSVVSGESIGHKSGRKIITILKTPEASLSDDDYTHMKKVISYVARHTKQGGPDKDKEHSNWRYSLQNWGHDPLKG
jgi:DNA topoisomerase VI subunit B